MKPSTFVTFCSLIALSASRPTTRQTSSKPIFAHYLIGEIYDEHTRQDIVDAQALGLDAFALNLNTLSGSWATDTVDRLFDNADELGFGLFFSFDMATGYFSSPSEYASYLKDYISRDSYFKYNGKPLLSTFGGESVSNSDWGSFKSSVGDILVVPGFHEAAASTTFFESRSNIDGVFNWNSWPGFDEGRVAVATLDDTIFQTAAGDDKIFMMGISPLQFKHIDSNQNWYRRGEGNLESRLLQALETQPDMIELQTWNDAGESHYMGNLWDEPMTGSPIHKYVDGYDHTGYWQILPAFVEAWKRGDTDGSGMVPTNGKMVQGTYWHHTLTVGGSCEIGNGLGMPRGIENAEDAVSGVILVANGQTSLTAVVNAGGGSKELGKVSLKEGYNAFSFDGLVTGKVTVEIWDGTTMVGGGYGELDVVDSASICNYNFQVVGFPN